jgi:RNA polymerase-binding protein DksA
MAIRARRMHSLEEPLAPAIAQERRRALEFILRERRRLLGLAFTVRDVSPDPLDVAREIEEEQVWLAMLDQSRKFQDQIDEAMRLLAEGRYGRCIECGKSIPPRRLRALPFALRCLQCQERYETWKSPMHPQTHLWSRILWDQESEGPDES